jgi:hypothetical protein
MQVACPSNAALAHDGKEFGPKIQVSKPISQATRIHVEDSHGEWLISRAQKVW